MSLIFFILCQFSVIATGVVSGVFLTFSDFLMKSLHSVPRASGVQVMQTINRDVVPTLFMGCLLGMTAVSLLLAGMAIHLGAGSASYWALGGASLYLFGVFGVTLVFNVPMNKRLATLPYEEGSAHQYWVDVYRPRWTRFNGVRALCAALASGCFLLACLKTVGG